MYNAESVEIKRDKASKERKTQKPTSKKEPPNGKGSTQGEGPNIPIGLSKRSTLGNVDYPEVRHSDTSIYIELSTTCKISRRQ
jgi:hypothetical protein